MSCLALPATHTHAKDLLAAKLVSVLPMRFPSSASPDKSDENGLMLDKALPQPWPSEHPRPVIELWGEDATDFGSWKIILSGRSLGDLRQIRRSDRHAFDIVKKKLQ